MDVPAGTRNFEADWSLSALMMATNLQKLESRHDVSDSDLLKLFVDTAVNREADEKEKICGGLTWPPWWFLLPRRNSVPVQ